MGIEIQQPGMVGLYEAAAIQAGRSQAAPPKVIMPCGVL